MCLARSNTTPSITQTYLPVCIVSCFSISKIPCGVLMNAQKVAGQKFSTSGLVAMTSASPAESRQLDPGQVYGGGPTCKEHKCACFPGSLFKTQDQLADKAHRAGSKQCSAMRYPRPAATTTVECTTHDKLKQTSHQHEAREVYLVATLSATHTECRHLGPGQAHDTYLNFISLQIDLKTNGCL